LTVRTFLVGMFARYVPIGRRAVLIPYLSALF